MDLLGVSAAGLLLRGGDGGARLVASTSEDVRLLELYQLQVGQGPCLDALCTSAPVTVLDLTGAGERWPEFAPQAVALGYHRVQAVPLQWRGQTIGVCNLFGTSGGTGFATDDLAVTQALAAVATIVVLQRRSMLRQEELTGQLQTALNTRVVIEQAKGVIAERGGLDMDQAYGLLRRHARHHGRKLSEVAHAVAEDTTARDAVLREVGLNGARSEENLECRAGYPGADAYRDAGVPGGLNIPGTASGFGTHTSASNPSGSRKNTLNTGPKSVTTSSHAPRASSRPRISSNATSDAACSPRWSSRPRPNMGTCRWDSALPSTSNTLSSVCGPMLTIDMRRAPSRKS